MALAHTHAGGRPRRAGLAGPQAPDVAAQPCADARLRSDPVVGRGPGGAVRRYCRLSRVNGLRPDGHQSAVGLVVVDNPHSVIPDGDADATNTTGDAVAGRPHHPARQIDKAQVSTSARVRSNVLLTWLIGAAAVALPVDAIFVRVAVFTPSFVVLRDGAAVGRIEGDPVRNDLAERWRKRSPDPHMGGPNEQAMARFPTCARLGLY